MKKDAQFLVQELLDAETSSGAERGLQVTAYHRGKLIVDAWSGMADGRSGRAVHGETLFPIFSVSKGIAATIVHRLAERGLLDYDRPIAELWPEFGAAGKGAITLRQALNHTAGLPNLPPGMTFADLADWTRSCAAVAKLAPSYQPGDRAEYHAITFGWIVGEAACRATGKSFPELLRAEIAAPLGMSDLYMGIPDQVEDRVAWLEEIPAPAPPTDPQAPSPVPGWLGPLFAFMNRPDMRRACLPASSGIMPSRAIAKHYAALLPGGVDGVTLLSPARLALATADQQARLASGQKSTWALGYHSFEELSGPSGIVPFGHGGHGGAVGLADPGRHLALGVAKNSLNDRGVAARIFRCLADALEG